MNTVKNKNKKNQSKMEKKLEKEKRKDKWKLNKTLENFLKDKKGAMGLRPYVINLMLIVFISLALISFIFLYLQANALDNELITNSSLSKPITDLTQGLNKFQATTNNVSGTLGGSTPAPISFVFLIFEAAFYIPRTIFVVMTSIPSLLSNIIFPSLVGTGWGAMINIFIGLIGGIIILTLVFLTVKAVRSGESER